MASLKRAFVVMPFGRKVAVDKTEIDFDAVYERLIAPAVRDAGFEPHRADTEIRAGSIHADMFQELLLSELVVAELSIDNPNVFYELGVRHALRNAGIVMLYDRSRRPPFDIAGERMLPYSRISDAPDEQTLAADRSALTGMISATIHAWRGRKVSPVFRTLPYLEEPNWRRLKVGDVNEYWEALEAWNHRITLAQQRQRPGDILLLADEPPSRMLEVEALCKAADALLKLNRSFYALNTVERALAFDPDNLRLRQMKGIALGRCGRLEETRLWLEAIAKTHEDGETLGILGRTYKEAWTRQWLQEDVSAEQRRQEAAASADSLADATEAYLRAFRANPGDYYPGINAVTLSVLYADLTGETPRADLSLLVSGVRWAATAALDREKASGKGYWPAATLAELELVSGGGQHARLFRQAVAIAVARSDLFGLESTSQQLELLTQLGFRPEQAAVATAMLAKARSQLRHAAGDPETEPKRVVVFSGHMIDAPDREPPRFPAALVPSVRARIEDALGQLGLQGSDLGLCGGACGGDLLFAEACLKRGARVELRLARREPEFLRESVTFSDTDRSWYEAFRRVTSDPRVRTLVMPDELGDPPQGVNAHDRCNRWILYSALSKGLPKVRGLALWDGKVGDGPGGTEHMVRLVHELTGHRPIVIDPALSTPSET
jgi:tetratricopeptide (TPR) repeat protein